MLIAGIVQRAVTDPVQLFHFEPVGEEGFTRTNNDAPVWGVDFHDIKRLTRGDAKAAALADCVVDDAVMLPQNPAIKMHDFTAAP